MYLHIENLELFHDVIGLVSERLGISEDIIEKDYFVTMILHELVKTQMPVVFKGGTALSKAFHVIERFSEDIDITFSEHLGESRRKRLKYQVLKPIAEKLQLRIQNWEQIESDKNYNHYDFCYRSAAATQVTKLSALPSYVKLETALMSYAFPTETRQIGNYIYDVLAVEEEELIDRYGLRPFPMQVQSLNRTLIDKIFAVCDYYMLGKPERNARHLYDIYKIAPHVVVNEEFRALVEEVRDHRKQMGQDIAPAALLTSSDVVKRVDEIAEKDYYKADYTDTTLKLISDQTSYETVLKHYQDFVHKLFI